MDGFAFGEMLLISDGSLRGASYSQAKKHNLSVPVEWGALWLFPRELPALGWVVEKRFPMDTVSQQVCGRPHHIESLGHAPLHPAWHPKE